MLGALAVIYAAQRGTATFEQWRKQKNEERRIAVAEEVLTLAYKCKRAFEAIRSGGMLAGEALEMRAKLTEIGCVDEETSPGKEGMLMTAQAALSRTYSYRDLFNSLLDASPVTRAILGNEVASDLDAFWMKRAELITAAQTYARMASDREIWEGRALERQIARRERLEATLWGGEAPEYPDKFARTIDEIVDRMEARLLPVIRSDIDIGSVRLSTSN